MSMLNPRTRQVGTRGSIELARTQLDTGFNYSIAEQEHFDCRGHQVHLDIREHTNPNVTLYVDFEVSTDDGATWAYGGGFTQKGGPAFDKDGVTPLKYTVCVFGHEPHPDHPPAAHRRIRGTVRAEGGPTRAKLELIGLPGINVDKSQIPTD